MKEPLVSIVIPTHNRPDLLHRALASVLAQTFREFEVIVSDDGDAEGGAEAVALGMGDARVRYLPAEKPHSGAPVARNRGVARAKAPLVAFLDDDDEWLPEKLGKQYEKLSAESEDVGFCFTAVTNVFDDREVRTSVEEGVHDFSDIALRRFNGFMTSTLLVRKQAFLAVGGFDESFPSHQEAELMIRLAARYRGLGIDEPLVRMSASASYPHIGSSFDRRIRGREMLLGKHAARYASRPAILARHYFWLAFLYRDAGRKQDALRALREAWRLDKRPAYLLRRLILRLSGR